MVCVQTILSISVQCLCDLMQIRGLITKTSYDFSQDYLKLDHESVIKFSTYMYDTVSS